MRKEYTLSEKSKEMNDKINELYLAGKINELLIIVEPMIKNMVRGKIAKNRWIRPEDREDVIQMSFISASEKLIEGKFNPSKGTFATWFYSFIGREIIRYPHKLRPGYYTAARKTEQNKNYSTVNIDEYNEFPYVYSLSAEDAYFKQADYERLLNAINHLTKRQKTCLCYSEGIFGHEKLLGSEISERLGISPGTVRSTIFKARERIKCYLAEDHAA